MQETRRTKTQLARELTTLRAKLKKLEKSTEKLRQENDALRESDQRYHSIVDNSGDAILFTVSDGRILAANPAACKMFGRAETELRKLGCNGIVDSSDPKWAKALEERERTGKFKSELTLLRRNRQSFPAEVSSAVFKDHEGHSRTSIIIREITERKRAEDVLRESEEWFRNLADTTSTGIFIYQGERLIYGNHASEMMSGYTRDELLKLRFWDLIHPDHQELVRERGLARTRGESVTKRYEVKIVRKDGEERWMDYTAGRLDWRGRPAVIGTIFDITERKLAEEASKRAEEALSKSEKQYSTLFNSIDEGFCTIEVIFDENQKPIDYRFLVVNRSFEKQTGLIDAAGKRMRELAPKHEEHWFEIYGKIAVTGEPARFVNRAEQLHRWYDVYAFRIGQPENRQVAILFNDITERKRAEARIEEERKLLRSIIDAIPDEIAVKDLERKFVLANEGFLRALGKQTLAQVVGLRDEDLIPERFARDAREKEIHVLTSGETLFDDIPEPRRNPDTGELIRAFTSTRTPLHDHSGRLFGLVVVNRNITELHRAQETLSQSETRFRAVWDHSLVGMRLTDAEGNIVMVNQSFCQLFKKESEELVGRSLADTYIPKPGENIVGDYRERFRNRKISPFLEAQVTIWNGEALWLELSHSFLFVPDHQELLLTVFRDITERRLAEEALRMNEQRFRSLIEHSQDAIVLMAADGTVLYDSPSVKSVLGYNSSERIGRKVFEFVPPEEREGMVRGFAKFAQQTGAVAPSELRFVQKDGTVRHIEGVRTNLLQLPSVGAIVVNYRDITDRKLAELASKRAEEVLRESEERYRDLVEHSHDLICTHDLEGIVLSVNSTATRLTGFTREELEGKNLRDLLAPEARGLFNGYLARIRAVGSASGLMPVITKSGERRVWEYFNTLRSEGVAAPIVRGLARDITDRRRTEMQLKRRVKELHAIHRSALAMQGIYSLDRLVPEIIGILEGTLQYDYGAVLLVDENGDRLIPYAVSGEEHDPKSAEADKAYIRSFDIRVGHGIVGWVAQNGTSVRLGDVTKDARYHQVREAIRSELCVPLMIGNQVIGVVNIETPKPDAYTEADQLVLETVAAQIAAAIHDARMFESLQGELAERRQVEEALRAERDRFTKIAKTSPGAICSFRQRPDGSPSFPYASPAIQEIYGLQPEDLADDASIIRALIHPDDMKYVRENITESARALTPWRNEYRFRHPTKGEVWIESHFMPEREPDGGTIWQGVLTDISERKRVEASLKRTLEWQEAIFEGSRDAVFISDQDSRFAAVNQAACDLTGYSREQLLNMRIPDVHDHPDLAAYKTYHKRILDGEEILTEAKILRADGTKVDAEFNNKRVSIAEEIYMHTTARDITERHRAEKELRESETKYHNLFNNVEVGIFRTRFDGSEVLDANERFLTIFGRTREEVVGKPSVIHWADPREREEMVRRLKKDNRVSEYECRMLNKKGQVRHCLTSLTLHAEQGLLEGSIMDITERKLAELASKQSEEHLREAQTELRLLAGHLESVREEERKHLSQEFHDQLGQTLTAIKMELSMLHHLVTNPNKEMSRSVIVLGIDAASRMVNTAIGNLRGILSDLRPEMLDQLGIVPTLEWEVEKVRRHSDISCIFESEVEELALSAKDAIALYRIFQEAITNVVRHANATSLKITLRRESGTFVLEIIDNGVGISADANHKVRSFGLISMRERAILLGGTLEIDGVEGKGTSVRVRIPSKETFTNGESVQ